MKKVLTYYLKPYYARMALGFFVKFMGTIMDLALPWILAYIIDTVIPSADRGKIFFWGFLMLVCSVLALTFNVIANRMASRVAANTCQAIRHDLFERTMNLSSAQTDFYTKPSLLSRLTADTYNIHHALGRIQRLGVRAPILLVGGIIITMTLDPVLSLILIAFMPILIAVIILVSRKCIPMYQGLQGAVDRFVRLVREDIAGIRVIKALSKTKIEREKFEQINQEVVSRERKVGTTTAVISPSMNFLLNLGLIIVILAGASRVNSGLTEVGKILAFMNYFTIILNTMISFSSMFDTLSKAVASANRIDMILEEKEDLAVIQLLEEEEEAAQREDAFLVFDHVSFSYNKAETNVADIHFAVKKGETLGIIGETGAGKSTVMNLLLRFYDPDEGRILIGGRDVRSIPTGELRKLFGITFQNDTIFEDSIKENVLLGRELDDADAWEAILYAQAKDFVDKREGKLEEKLDIKGANLSGGQKQRILIARALAAKPEILLLDDASSALDYKTDAALRRGIGEHFAGTTTVIIAQRISSIMHADHILVLEDGHEIGYGTHDELMRDCSIYREISESQMGG